MTNQSGGGIVRRCCKHDEVIRTMLNLAANKPALQSSTSRWSTSKNPAEDAKQANNDDVSGKAVFHTELQQNPWWQVDLEDEFVVETVKIYNRHAAAERLRNFSILASVDGQTWSVIFKKKDDVVFGKKDDIPYICHIPKKHLVRYLRVRLDGRDYLHFHECQVFGVRPDAALRQRLTDAAAAALALRSAIPDGRTGFVSEFDDIAVFVDTKNYSEPLARALTDGRYEVREREVLKTGLRHGDRVLEGGTAVGVVTMAAALIAGAENVITFEANPAMVADSSANFRRNGLEAITSRLGVLKNRRAIKAPDETMDFHVSRDFVSSRLAATSTEPDIIKTVKIPVFCLEDQIQAHRANVLLFDIEGAETDLFLGADLSGIRTIMIETHYKFAGEAATDAMVRKFYMDGFDMHLGVSGNHVLLLRR